MELVYIIGNRHKTPRIKFAEAELELRRMGYIAINPLEEIIRFNEFDEEGLCSSQEEQAFLQPFFDRCNAVYVLPCWEGSRAAKAEYDNSLIDGKKIMWQTIRVGLNDIIKAAEDVTGIPLERLKDRSRKASLVEIRRAIFYLAWKYQSDTLVAIGRVFGMDHTTVIHAKNTALNLLDSGDKRTMDVINEIKQKLIA